MALPSDHHIEDEAAFLEVVERAAESAQGGVITTLGITPTGPETGYGYIEATAEVATGVLRAERFVEKPDRQRAEQYLKSGHYYWNSGMFFFRASALLDAVRAHLPELGRGVDRIEAAAKQGSSAEEAETRAVFPTLPSISIDYGVMEKVTPIHVVPADFGWSDVGSWTAAWDLGRRDEDGNVADAGAVLVDATGNLVRDLGGQPGRVIALVGVHDLCVIQTDDALLVMPREKAQEVRRVVQELERRGRHDKV